MILAACSPSLQSMARSSRLLIYAPSQQTSSPQDRPGIETRQSTILAIGLISLALHFGSRDNLSRNEKGRPHDRPGLRSVYVITARNKLATALSGLPLLPNTACRCGRGRSATRFGPAVAFGGSGLATSVDKRLDKRLVCVFKGERPHGHAVQTPDAACPQGTYSRLSSRS